MCEVDFVSYADDNTHYVLGNRIDDLLDSLEDDFINLFKYLLDNQMKANSNRCNLITNKQSCISLKIGNLNFENNTCKNLLGVKVGSKLNFNYDLDGINKKLS